MTEIRRYLPGAVHSYFPSTGGVKTNYLLKDHLGSVDTIVNDSGEITEKLYFNAWGERKQLTVKTNWSAQAQSIAVTTFELIGSDIRGFTGHEHVEHANIIHMNGRIYDPTLGRFLQADPHIQAPNNSQSFNRYSYLMNNPLSGTDPSGYIGKFLRKAVGVLTNGIVGELIASVIPQARALFQAFACFYGGPVGCAASSFGNTIAGGGSLKSAFTNAAFAYASAKVNIEIGEAFNGVGFNGEPSAFFQAGGAGHIATHALIGGVSAELRGGKFGHGFFSAGFAKGLNINDIVGTTQGAGWDALRISVAAVVGGSISKLTGGKFSNGAVTAAFAQAFNGNRYAKREDAIKRALNTLQQEYRLINGDGGGLYSHPAKGHIIGTYVTEETEYERGFLGWLQQDDKVTYYVASVDATINGADFYPHMSTSLAGAQKYQDGVSDWFLAYPEGGSPDFRFATSVGVYSIFTWDVQTGFINHYTYSSDTQDWTCTAYKTGGQC